MLALQVGAAGMVINTMGWVEGLGFQLLMHAIQAMQADVVLVVGQDRLFQQLQASHQVEQLSPESLVSHRSSQKINRIYGLTSSVPVLRSCFRVHNTMYPAAQCYIYLTSVAQLGKKIASDTSILCQRCSAFMRYTFRCVWTMTGEAANCRVNVRADVDHHCHFVSADTADCHCQIVSADIAGTARSKPS